MDYHAELETLGILILKSELVWRTAFETRADATAAIGRYIDGFYNLIRCNCALDFTSSVQFEKVAANCPMPLQ